MDDKPMHAELRPLPGSLLRSVLEYADRPTQVSCARVCKGWHEVVISVLWHRVDDIGRLLRVFRVNGAQPYIIPGACWTRVFHYSNHIKELTVGPNGLENLLEAIILSIHLHSLYLTPNLVTLCWQSHQSLYYSLLFLPPGLSSLSIDEYEPFGPMNERCQLFQAIMERCPNMISFDSSGPQNNDSARSTIELIFDRRGSLMARQWKIDAMEFGDTVFNFSSENETGGHSRVSYSIFQISRKVGQHLASKYAGSVEDLGGLKSTPMFSALREIYLELGTWQSGQGMHMAPMAFMDAMVRDRYHSHISTNLRLLCAAIADSACQVEIIVISASHLSGVGSISFHVFQSLLRCRSLTTFVIMTHSPVLISDSELESLAKAWPSLQHLYLSPLATLQRREGQSLPSLGVICSLPAHCPNLHSLSLLVAPRTDWKVCLQPFSQLKSLYLSFSEGQWSDDEVASTIVEATLGSCTILLRPAASRDSNDQIEPTSQHADSVRRVQQDISYWRSMRNRCLEAIVTE